MIETADPWALAATVVVLATVQSVFGVGLLVFGTPVLLLMGLPFEEILAYLLPCSMAISLLQVAGSGGLTLEPVRRQFLVFGAPAVVAAAIVAVFFGSPGAIGLAVGVMLLVSAVLRLVTGGDPAVSTFVTRYRAGLFVVLGVVHGLSNLGGGILAAIVGFSVQDKVSIRRHIAFCYGVMASLQFVVVLVKGPDVQPALWVLLPLLAATVYLLVGQRLFLRTSRATYQHALTGLLAAFGTLLVTR
jgi:uncharacterized protein